MARAMPWKATCHMEERMRFVLDVRTGRESVACLCRRFGISRQTGYKWLARYEAQGPVGLVDRSSRPHRSPLAIPPWVAELVVAVRKSYSNWGPRKIRAHLQSLHPSEHVPSAGTIGRVLRDGGLTRPRRRHRKMPRYTEPFAGCQGPNDVWAADFKGHFKTGRHTCYPLTITDGYSRYLLHCEALRVTRFEQVQRSFESVFRAYGLPTAVRTDNGPPFASVGPGGLSKLSVWWIKLGIRPERIAPGHPEQNGRHERMHRTLKQETATPPRDSLGEQQQAFDRFRQQFNETRPHEALGQRPPSLFYQPSRRTFPTDAADPHYSDSYETYRVDKNGRIQLRGWPLRLGECLEEELVGVLDREDRFSVHFGPVLLGYVQKPSRRSDTLTLHPAGREGGRPTPETAP
jgi:transposase InsO family protein